MEIRQQPPTLTDLVRIFLIEQFPGLSIIFTHNSSTLRYHPVRHLAVNDPSIYVDGLHCGWLEDGQQFADLVDGRRLRINMADPVFFSEIARFAKRTLETYQQLRWSEAGIPSYLEEAMAYDDGE